ncbi:hypothetical protein AB9M75_08270 [Lactobacillus sp. AN1001]
MLKKNKSISLTGESTINGQLVAHFSANLSSEGGNSDQVSTYVNNRELYEANRREVRKDMSDFRQYVFDQEDELFANTEDEATEETK